MICRGGALRCASRNRSTNSASIAAGVVADPVIAAGLARRRVLQPVQRALAGQRRAVGAPGLELAGQDRQHRVVAELVVVDQVLVAERDAEHALADQRRDLVLDPLRHARVAEAGGEAPDQADRPVGGAEQQRAGVRGDRAAVEGATTGGLRQVQTRTAPGYTLSASGTSSAS